MRAPGHRAHRARKTLMVFVGVMALVGMATPMLRKGCGRAVDPDPPRPAAPPPAAPP